jgi:hypothetical protein
MDSGFVRASEYSPNSMQPNPDMIQWQEAIVGRLDALQESSAGPVIERRFKELEKKVASIATLKPEERQAIRETINDLLIETQSLRSVSDTQVRQIERLQDLVKDQSEQMGLLRDGIVRLQGEVASCKQQYTAEIGRIAGDIAADRRRIRDLEHPNVDTETNRSRAEKIKLYTSENATIYKFIDRRSGKSTEGRIVKFELLRLHLNCDKWQLNRALATLIKLYPGEYCKKKLNKNKWFLVELPKL